MPSGSVGPGVKELVTLAGERVARAKLNGRILRRSPSSVLVETEAMILGLTGQILVWRSLAASQFAADLAGDTDLGRFEARAVEERRELEQLHRDLVHEDFDTGRAGAFGVRMSGGT